MDVFVFGSNRAGIHGAGSALEAVMKHGAKLRHGEGLCGNSYAIPTKDDNIESLPLEEIEKHVQRFISFAEQNMNMEFTIVPIGCGLAGYTPEEIAPMFENIPDNCNLPTSFELALDDLYNECDSCENKCY